MKRNLWGIDVALAPAVFAAPLVPEAADWASCQQVASGVSDAARAVQGHGCVLRVLAETYLRREFDAQSASSFSAPRFDAAPPDLSAASQAAVLVI